jgi:hypothetical protein
MCSLLSLVMYLKRAYSTSRTLPADYWEPECSPPADYWEPECCTALNISITIT